MRMKKPLRTIKIAEDFSTEPYGRYPEDGDANGTRFRDEWMLPALQQFEKVVVILDGTEGYGSSFLEESFGGLVRIHRIAPDLLREQLSIVSEEDPSLISEIWEYVNSARG